MPSLNWIGKEKIVNHDKDVPFRLLRKNKKYSLGENENLILEGDNLEALKALMPFYYGKIKCIYIDPPYNTGNEKWVYNDKVNSPKIKEWLGKIVGPEGEDLTRHDKWLCMMYPRLKLLHDLLDDDGVIFVSIDDNEHCYLKQILDDVFGPENFIASFHWRRVEGKPGISGLVGNVMEHIVCFAKDKQKISFHKIPISEAAKKEYRYSDKKGFFRRGQIFYPGRGTYAYSVMSPYGNKIGGDFTVKEDEFRKFNKAGEIYWAEGGDHTPYKKVYLEDTLYRGVTNDWSKDFGSNQSATKEIKQIFGEKLFDNPKPVKLIKRILQIATNTNDLILDSFAGSGTTAHAVLDLNKEDGGNRKFILVELEKNIAKNITAERVRRVARGYSYKTGKGKVVKVPGLGGGFEYVELGEPLFDKDGMISKAVSFEDMARYVYFTETRTNLEKKNIKRNYLGEFSGNHYFLLFNGIDKNVLDRKFLKELKGEDGRKIIYADKCLLDEEVLEKYQIVFKQIPYQVRVY